jgi:hypothetical protein
MIGYRFLSVAEEEMSEAAVFYEARTPGLGGKFLDDVQQVVARLRVHPMSEDKNKDIEMLDE